MSDLEVSIKEEEEQRSSWSDLHPDLLAEIFKNLDIVDYARCMRVCASWRSTHVKPKGGRQLPWLLVSSRCRGNTCRAVSRRNDTPLLVSSRRRGDPRPLCFYGLSCFDTKMAKYGMRLPQIKHCECIGSSQGFIITVDDPTRLCAMNPLTGARFPLPPTATHPDILIYDELHPNDPPRLIIPDSYTEVRTYYHKAVISQSLDTIAVAIIGSVNTPEEPGIFISFRNLAYARVGDGSWTTPVLPSAWRHRGAVSDFIFHKGCLYAVYQYGYLVVFNLEIPDAPPLVSPMMDQKIALSALLTETPDGEDLLLLWRKSPYMGVCRLDKNTLKWNHLQSAGDVAFFSDGRYLSSLSTRVFPCLKSNCVYFTTGSIGIRIYDLEDGLVHPLIHPGDIGGLYQSTHILFTPAL